MIKEIIQITEGRMTKKFRRYRTESGVQESFSFSLHTKKRTLDLEGACLLDKQNFLKYLHILMNKNSMTNFTSAAGNASMHGASQKEEDS